MVIKVFFERLESAHRSAEDHDLGGAEDPQQANVSVRVKNTDTLDEFRGESFCNPLFFEKISQWIKKKKYETKAINNNSEMELKVEIFKFPLKKVPKSDEEILKQEICSMRKDNQRLKGELKMFRYYFLNMWKERSRIVISEKQELKQELVESAQNLYDQMKTEGIILEEFGSKVHYLKIQMASGSGAGAASSSEQTFNQHSAFTGTPGGPSGTPTGNPAASAVSYQV
jgi:hypothetical protein